MKRGKWKSRIASLLVFVMTFLSAVNVTSFESSAAGLERYTVLVLDTSGATNFLDENHKVFYTADTAVEYVKLAAKNLLRMCRKQMVRIMWLLWNTGEILPT